MRGSPLLTTALNACARSFAEFEAAHLRQRTFLDLDSRWRSHYRGPFADLDRQIRAHEDFPTRQALVPLSIAHHNLERLFEVLRIDIQGPTLDSVRVPERVLDLEAAIARVRDEVRHAGGPLARETVASEGSGEVTQAS